MGSCDPVSEDGMACAFFFCLRCMIHQANAQMAMPITIPIAIPAIAPLDMVSFPEETVLDEAVGELDEVCDAVVV